MCVLAMLKNEENNGMETIGLVTPTPGVVKSHMIIGGDQHLQIR